MVAIWLRYEDMLTCEVAYRLHITNMLHRLPPSPFREGLACVVLNGLSAYANTTYTPDADQTGADFFETIAFGLAYSVEGERPVIFSTYEDGELAYLLLERFITAYLLLENEHIPDDQLHRIACIPTFPRATAHTTLIERIRSMLATDFGQYPGLGSYVEQPESP